MDFDNTISVGNVSIEVRDEFAPNQWLFNKLVNKKTTIANKHV